MRPLIVDVQVLQTPALNRGMGQYILSVLEAMQAKKRPIILVMSSEIDNKYTQAAKEKLADHAVHLLPLTTLGQTMNTKQAIKKNGDVLTKWIKQEGLEGADFLLGSIFQAEIYPAFPKAGVQKSAVMYDVIPIQFFDIYHKAMRWSDYLDRYNLVYEAQKLLCISRTTANDLQIYASVPAHKIAVINGGPGNVVHKSKPAVVPGGKFVLMPTGNDIRKNNLNAVAAFHRANQTMGGAYKLVITSTFTEEEQARLRSLCDDIIFTGVVSDAELAWYFSACDLLLFPSLYEGLGMPLIEAMLFDKKIAASNIDVFAEITDSAVWYFQPNNVMDMSAVIEQALNDKLSAAHKKEYKRVLKDFSWSATAKAINKALEGGSSTPQVGKKERIAILGPKSTGSSAIGKFIAEIDPAIRDAYEIDYFYEGSQTDKILRPDILGHVARVHPIHELTESKLRSYKGVYYHIGNSNHHTLIMAWALRIPGIVILHDLHIQNIYIDLVERNLIGQNRKNAEEQLDTLRPSKSSYIQSLVARQKAIIVHSKYAKQVVEELTDVPVLHAEHPIQTPLYPVKLENKSFTIGLAGILAGVKGLRVLETIAQHTAFKQDKIRLFGLNFAEPGVLDTLRQLPNVHIETDLSDFEFQQGLKRLDALVNYRTEYRGEASRATLESMRYGVPAIVRGDFGWYAELPEDSVVKVQRESDVLDKLVTLRRNKKLYERIRETAISTSRDVFGFEQYADAMRQALEQTS